MIRATRSESTERQRDKETERQRDKETGSGTNSYVSETSLNGKDKD